MSDLVNEEGTSQDLKDLEQMFIDLRRCCLHEPIWTPVDCRKVVAHVWSGEYEGGWVTGSPGSKTCSESRSFTVVQFHNGEYGLLYESEDYTGHGCQCDAGTSAYKTLDELLRYGVDSDGATQAILLAANV